MSEKLTLKKFFPKSPDLSHIPGENGFPLIGHTLKFINNPLEFSETMTGLYGNTYRINLLFSPVIMVSGAEPAQLVLQNRSKAFSSKALEKMVGDFLPGGLLLTDFEDHRSQRSIMMSVFKKPALVNYIELMHEEVKRDINNWHLINDFLAYPQIKKLNLGVGGSVFFGLDGFTEETEHLLEEFTHLMRGTTALVKFPIPGNKFYKATNARNNLEKFFYSLIPHRRGQDKKDLFTKLCNAVSEEDSNIRYTDEEIVNHAIFMLAGAHDSTASAFTSMAYFLTKYPGWQDRLRNEIKNLNSDFNYDNLKKLALCESFFQETLRIYPPAPYISRTTLTEIEINGHAIPQNTNIGINTYANHYHPDYWTNPQKFDPERFLPDRAEHKKTPFSFIAFGGGAHACIARQFATIEAKIFLIHLLNRYQISTPKNYQTPFSFMPFPHPKDELPLHFELIDCLTIRGR